MKLRATRDNHNEPTLKVYSNDTNRRRNFVQMSPEHNPPTDDTTRMIVDSDRAVHRANAYSILLDRGAFTELTGWLNRAVRHGSGQYRIPGPRMDAHLMLMGGLLLIRIETGPFGFTTALGMDGIRELVDWMIDKDVNGWDGWKSGRAGGSGKDGGQ
jgi:hypothetical protein